jgi:hypothetical protein
VVYTWPLSIWSAAWTVVLSWRNRTCGQRGDVMP